MVAMFVCGYIVSSWANCVSKACSLNCARLVFGLTVVAVVDLVLVAVVLVVVVLSLLLGPRCSCRCAAIKKT